MSAARRGAVRGWRGFALAMTWIWRGQPGVLMTAYLGLAVLAQWIVTTMHVPGGEVSSGGWLLPIAFWCWRVAGGGRISRRILFFLSGASYAGTVVHLASWWDPQAVGLLAIAAAELALLLSPAVYLRTRLDSPLSSLPGAVIGIVPPVAELRLRPKRWILEASVVTGPVAALGIVAAKHFPDQTALAFGQDSARCALAIFPVLYLLRLSQHARPESLPAAVPGCTPVPAR